MAQIEHGEGALVSADTKGHSLHFREILNVGYEGQPPAKEWEIPYRLEFEEEDFYRFVGKRVDYVLSDGVVVDINLLR